MTTMNITEIEVNSVIEVTRKNTMNKNTLPKNLSIDEYKTIARDAFQQHSKNDAAAYQAYGYIQWFDVELTQLQAYRAAWNVLNLMDVK